MLRTYGNEFRPQQAIDAIVSATAGYEEKTLKKWQKIGINDSDYLYIILRGEVDIRRCSDDLCILTSHQECIYGMSSFFNIDNHTYGIVRSDAVVRKIKRDDFENIIVTNGLWPELSKILAWCICFLSQRDSVLVARSAYSVIREFLLEIHELETLHRRSVNIYDYIQEYTNLARSTIVKILSELKRGKYINVENGRLLAITALPDKY